ncbi:cfem domain-containing protein [Rutstroemia sp. NJR-2017a WRK4]|nr:cfem domain-containing protein [Rutstroemia sp. NJR-2017a WRK4]
MRSIQTILAVVASFSVAIVTAQSPLMLRQDSASVLAAAEAAYPICALKCMAEAVPASTCSATDVVCLCSNTALQGSITACAMESCTVAQLLTTKNVTETMCGAPVRNRAKQVSYIGVIGGAVALVAFLIRVVASAMKLRKWGSDDWAMCVVVALAVPPTVFSVILADNGLGKDMWTLEPKNITNILFYYFLGECFYLAAMATMKISFCLLFIRLFREKPFIYYVHGTLALSVGYGVSFVIATICQCHPISYEWTQWDGLHKGRCNNINLQGWMSAIFNIVLDLIVIALPLGKLSKLVMTFERKLTIMCMFSLGLFVTAISIVRLSSLIEFATSDNITWDYVPAAYFSTLELHVGILCGCLPALKPLLNMLLPKLTMTMDRSMQSNITTSKSVGAKGGNKDMGDFIPLKGIESPNSKFYSSSVECTAV